MFNWSPCRPDALFHRQREGQRDRSENKTREREKIQRDTARAEEERGDIRTERQKDRKTERQKDRKTE